MTEHNDDDHNEALTTRERDALAEQEPMRAVAIFESIRREGRTELNRPLEALTMSGLVAGLALGFSVLAQALIHAQLPDTDWRILIDGFGYCFGFLLVILGQLQLFTENTIKAVCPVLDRPTLAVAARVARLWALVLGSNVAGAAAFGAALWLTRTSQPAIWEAVGELSRHALAHGFGETLLRGVGAGWLMAALVWMLPNAGGARSLVVVVVTYVIVLAGFSHVVAGATEAAVLVLMGERSLASALGGYILPSALGNLLGGTVLFTVLVWVQIRNELKAGLSRQADR